MEKFPGGKTHLDEENMSIPGQKHLHTVFNITKNNTFAKNPEKKTGHLRESRGRHVRCRQKIMIGRFSDADSQNLGVIGDPLKDFLNTVHPERAHAAILDRQIPNFGCRPPVGDQLLQLL